jgi:hypothetical protein
VSEKKLKELDLKQQILLKTQKRILVSENFLVSEKLKELDLNQQTILKAQKNSSE